MMFRSQLPVSLHGVKVIAMLNATLATTAAIHSAFPNVYTAEGRRLLRFHASHPRRLPMTMRGANSIS
jgi:hypothetical protein